MLLASLIVALGIAVQASIGFGQALYSRLRANLAFMFLFGTTISLVMLSTVGRFGMTEVRYGMVLHLGVMLGILVSGVLRRKLAQTKVRPLLLGLCALPALLVLARGISTLL